MAQAQECFGRHIQGQRFQAWIHLQPSEGSLLVEPGRHNWVHQACLACKRLVAERHLHDAPMHTVVFAVVQQAPTRKQLRLCVHAWTTQKPSPPFNAHARCCHP
jgi:hypothetical protein